MMVFIDESGRFIPGDGWSVVCALSLPHKLAGQARRQIQFMSRSWERRNGELKGGQVTFHQFRELVDCLFRHRAILHCCAAELQSHDPAEIDGHKAAQADAMTRHLTDEHHPDLVAEVWKLRRTLEAMPNQLYVQSVLMRELVCIVAEETSHYFAQRTPRELARYQWIIDAKDVTETRQEKWWRDVLGPLIESRSEREPFGKVDDPEFDYRFLEKSYSFRKQRWRPDAPREEIEGVDIRKMFIQATQFADSKSDILLQAVDILASYCRRSLRADKVDPEVLHQAGRLQISRNRDGIQQCMNLLALGKTGETFSSRKIGRRMRIMNDAARSLWAPNSAD